jgi:DNA gyrase subunit A
MDLASYRSEKKELQEKISYLEDLLAHDAQQVALIKDEMQSVVTEFGDERRTAILSDENATAPVAEVRAAIESKPVLVALASDGGLKAMPANTYAGKSNAGTVRGDERLISVRRAHTTDYLLCQLSTGRVASVRAARLPETTRAARAELPRSFISLDPGERIVDVAPVSAFSEEVYLLVFTREGRVKKTALSEYLRVDEKPSPDLRLLGKDSVAAVLISPGGGDYVVTTSDGKTLRFSDADVRAEGRATGGVATMQVAPKTSLISAFVGGPNEDALLIAQSGRTTRATPEGAPLVARDRRGSIGIKLEEADPLAKMVALPS